VAPARRLHLVRHGRSAHVHAGWIDATGFRAWRVAYEAASIRDDERVPSDLQQLATGADLVVASDAPRAVASARLLAPPGKEVMVSPLLRELDLEGPSMGGLRLPLAAWALAVGGQMLLRTLRRQHPFAAEAARVAQAAAWLDDLAARHATILAVTHASVRAQLSRQLARTGWNPAPGRRSLRPWSAWSFTRSAPIMPATG
jgi:broad specificity phosphatase PhoE